MDEWLQGDPDDDSDRPDDSRPSIETIVAAFRQALSEQRGRGPSEPAQSPSSPPPKSPERDPEEEADQGTGVRPGAETSRDSESGTDTDRSSRRNLIEDTIVAFRKAQQRGGAAGRSEEVRSRRSQPEPGRPTDTGAGPSRRPGQERHPRQERTGRDDPSAGADEDYASDFREALEERGAPGRQSTADRSGRDESDRERQSTDEPSEPEVEPVTRPGDAVPPSEQVEVSGNASSKSSDRSSAHGIPSDGSFLWVTDQPESDSSSISVENLGQPRARQATAFLVEGSGRRPLDLLKRIRGHAAVHIFLKPVFWVRGPGEESEVSEHVDGELTRDESAALTNLRERAASINRRVNNMVGGGATEESGMELRVLRFMATRSQEFAPRMTANNSDGFIYPKLTPLIERESSSGGGELVQILSILEDRRLVTGEFVMQQHACQNCGSGFLNFEERCPHCGSSDLDTDDLVHHFRCAFTGPLRKYKKEKGRLVCPKCDRTLKQIGVDYDKPSVVHTCRRCHEEFQDPEVQTTCYQCERTNPPEQQIEREIKKYQATALGEETAVYGLSDSLLSTLERESRVLDYATFQVVVESEAARIERYQRSASSLLLVQVDGLQQLRMDLGRRSQEVVDEMATAFDNTLRSSDYLSARDESLYLFLLTETDEQGARRAGERLEQNIEGVLGQNLEHPPDLNIAVQPLRPGMDLDDIAEQFLHSRGRERAPAGAEQRR